MYQTRPTSRYKPGWASHTPPSEYTAYALYIAALPLETYRLATKVSVVMRLWVSADTAHPALHPT